MTSLAPNPTPEQMNLAAAIVVDQLAGEPVLDFGALLDTIEYVAELIALGEVRD